METTKNKLSPFAEDFFNKMRNYLDNKLYFYGSIQRYDYFPESSDIDVDIFTDNENSTIIKIQNLLGVERNEFKKIIYRLQKTNKVVHGHKIKYEDEENDFTCELSIYNENIKEEILKEHVSKTNFPYYITALLVILKTLYYKIEIMPTFLYFYFKNLILNMAIREGKPTDFILNEIPKHDEEKEIKKKIEMANPFYFVKEKLKEFLDLK
jgi:hypothetical protein